jgi:DNA topoisomerase-1
MPMSEAITAYCMKCRQKRPIRNAEPGFNARGGPITRGTCPECGATLYRLGYTAAHKGLEKPAPPPKVRSGSLVIVESPAKARTIGRYLGKGYKVMASVGHVRDLLRSKLSVDVENDFAPRYRIPNEKRKVVKELAAAADDAAVVYLATDPDREGEAIAWHLVEAIGVEPDRVRRVVFHEITEDAIAEAFAHPTAINTDLVDAQQARRILDRLVGYKISPLLWARVRNRLTAGRVQSIAVRLIVEREHEIEAFEAEEYWTLDAELASRPNEQSGQGDPFIAKLYRIGGEAVELPDQASVTVVLDELESATYLVSQVRTGTRRRNAQPPFTTSTLQQAASTQLGFRAQRTMRVAQQLYEGVDLGGGGTVGLITYMRTDSVQVSAQAQQDARQWVASTYGQDYLPAEAPAYKTKSKSAQEAHEAIRPTGVRRVPKAMRAHLSRDQYRLYQLIWRRFVGSQMASAVYRTQSVDITAGPSNSSERPYLFRATGSQLIFPGYLVVYGDEAEEEMALLPLLGEGDELDLLRLLPEQHFTQPPPRYTEATLVKALEENGIGRPSTYAPIITTIQQRGYVQQADRSLQPTETGVLVDRLLAEYFPEVISIGFTARMEDELDEIAAGDSDWVPVIREFYTPFSARLETAEKEMPELNLGDQLVGQACPMCGGQLVVKWGRYGKFVACDNYPECRHTEPWLEKIGVSCPRDRCGGDLVRRRTRKGRTFYGCSNYPECEFTSWKLPLSQHCPHCGGLLVVQKKGTAECIACEEQVSIQDLQEES